MAIVSLGTYPPWKESGENGMPLKNAPIYAPPNTASGKAPEIDYSRLALMCGLAALIGAGLYVTSGTASAAPNQQPGQSPQPQAAAQASQPQTRTIVEPPAKEQSNLRTITLPGTSAIGDVLAESPDDPDYWDFVCEARGSMKIPTGKRLQLELKKDFSGDFSAISTFAPDILYSLDASDSKIQDKDLDYVGKLVKLKELDLSGTEVTAGGISSLSKLTELERLWLDGTKLDDSTLDKLQGNKKLVKLSLSETGISTDSVAEFKKSLPNCEVVIS